MVEQELRSLDDYDDNTRMKYSVETTLEEIKRILKEMDQIPANGLVIFGGRVQGNTKILVLSEELEKPVPETRYVSGSQFSTDMAQKITSRDSNTVLVIIELGNCVIGQLEDELTDIQEKIDVRIPSKHSKGGQSQSRFERRRKEAKKEFYRECEKRIENTVDGSSDFRIFVGGSEITVKEFVNQTSLNDRIRIINSIEYVNQTGMEKLKRESLKRSNDKEKKKR
jgi:peptide chain release factor subunit 1